ncbi:hypothetical protein [Mycetocola miduiensis]|uniref:Uncharacterized protein n=1 Tax=Mycetocola miduiensis TaxID=995034 RepID=A0A1I5AUE4_9MICO|nr:hypothetical protein [Mycetocola miduiensis]SFN66030.1 hypothetical protein SAMN05216219_1545 [Mycetocola miduiensis]
MFDPVPWFVGGGAQHSPEVARLLAYAATGGVEGVITPTDLKVLPLAVPGGAVRALPGAALILNRAVGGAQQTYVSRMPTETQVGIAATGSGAGRSDLIVARVEDPFMAGEPWQDPSDPKVGPYVFLRVIPNVPADTTRLQSVNGYEGSSAITLARIDIPASTGTITAAMIKDVRGIAQPKSAMEAWSVVGPGANTDLPTSAAWTTLASLTASGRIPEWATRAYANISVSGLLVNSGEWRGFLRVSITTAAGTRSSTPVAVTETNATYNWPGRRFSLPLGSFLEDLSALSGQPATVKVELQKAVGTGIINHGPTTVTGVSLNYMQAAI